MNKQQLLEYLDAVCDAEIAVQAYDDAIHTLSLLRHNKPKPYCPEKPTLETAVWSEPYVPNPPELSFALMPVGAVLGFLAGILLGNSIVAIIGGCVGLFGAPFLVDYIHKQLVKRKGDIAFEKAQIEVAARNRKAQEAYQVELYKYEALCIQYNAEIAPMDKLIDEQKLGRDKIVAKRNALYSKGIIYTSFQNLVAVYQIREYLKMGVCETLEGNSGAYAMYLNDVRSSRIFESIDEIRSNSSNIKLGMQRSLIDVLDTIYGNILASQNTEMLNLATHDNYLAQRLHNVEMYLLNNA